MLNTMKKIIILSTFSFLLSPFWTGCSQLSTLNHQPSPAAVVGTDFTQDAASALQAFAQYKADGANLTWALQQAFHAYQDIASTSGDVKALIQAWTGKSGESQKLADRLARVFGSSVATDKGP
jgi:hypothetical protein